MIYSDVIEVFYLFIVYFLFFSSFLLVADTAVHLFIIIVMLFKIFRTSIFLFIFSFSISNTLFREGESGTHRLFP